MSIKLQPRHLHAPICQISIGVSLKEPELIDANIHQVLLHTFEVETDLVDAMAVIG